MFGICTYVKKFLFFIFSHANRRVLSVRNISFNNARVRRNKQSKKTMQLTATRLILLKHLARFLCDEYWKWHQKDYRRGPSSDTFIKAILDVFQPHLRTHVDGYGSDFLGNSIFEFFRGARWIFENIFLRIASQNEVANAQIGRARGLRHTSPFRGTRCAAKICRSSAIETRTVCAVAPSCRNTQTSSESAFSLSSSNWDWKKKKKKCPENAVVDRGLPIRLNNIKPNRFWIVKRSPVNSLWVCVSPVPNISFIRRSGEMKFLASSLLNEVDVVLRFGGGGAIETPEIAFISVPLLVGRRGHRHTNFQNSLCKKTARRTEQNKKKKSHFCMLRRYYFILFF